MHPLEVLIDPGFYLLLRRKTAYTILVSFYGSDRNEAHPDFILIRMRVVT